MIALALYDVSHASSLVIIFTLLSTMGAQANEGHQCILGLRGSQRCRSGTTYHARNLRYSVYVCSYVPISVWPWALGAES